MTKTRVKKTASKRRAEQGLYPRAGAASSRRWRMGNESQTREAQKNRHGRYISLVAKKIPNRFKL